ncbi:hypothetical protein [Henriciella marina]|uniref:hypothetical protein n=1 Tax=Henriciella marina TaxID=453851 RepID=UPI0012E9BC05|nr:hypothetical protein [Henriciella marina]
MPALMGKFGGIMPISDFDSEDLRRDLLTRLQELADKPGSEMKFPELAAEIEDFFETYYRPPDEKSKAPPPGTVQNWLDGTTKAINRRNAHLIDAFLRHADADFTKIPITEFQRISDLLKFFGGQPKRIAQIGPALAGTWMMYRRWGEPRTDYIVSPVSFFFDANHHVITTTDTVKMRLKGAEFDGAEERWDGVALPQGSYVYTIYRTPDTDAERVNNLKFAVFDDLSFSDEKSSNGLRKLYIMSGFSMIGMNHHTSGNAFVCVLERVKKERTFPTNPVPFEMLPEHVKDRLDKKEGKFIRENHFKIQ